MQSGWAPDLEPQSFHREAPNYPESVASIVTAFNRNFRPILPKNKPSGSDQHTKNPLRPKICLELIEQYEITVQLLIQNFLYCNDEAVKQRCLEYFLRLVNGKQTIINYNRLPSYEIFLSDFVGLSTHGGLREELTVSFSPQVSILQCPILELENLIVNYSKKGYPKEMAIDFLKSLGPFIRRDWIGAADEVSSNTRTKFTSVDDALLLLGLKKMGCKDLSLTRNYFLTDKSFTEIRNRYKNLIRKKTTDNAIKNWKALQYAPLTELEQINVQKGLTWFGEENWVKVAKYFIPNRSAEFLQQNQVNDKRLLGKRDKCKYLFEDQNMDSIAIDLNYDLYQDKRKHHSDGGHREYFDTELPMSGFPQQFAKPFPQKSLFMPENSTLYGRTEFREGFDRGGPSVQRTGFGQTPNFGIGIPFPTAETGRAPPGFGNSVRVVGPMGHVTNYQNISINQHNIGYGGQFGGQGFGYQRVGGQTGLQAEDSLSFSNQVFGPFAGQYHDRMPGGRMSYGAAQAMAGPGVVNSTHVCRLEITQEDWDPAFADGKITVICERRYRSVKGVLFEILEDMEEFELLFR